MTVKSQQEVFSIVKQLRAELQEIYGSRLKTVYLFGSYARGEAKEGSDVDVTVMLDGMTSRFNERKRCSHLQARISLENSCVITLFFLEASEFLRGENAIYRTVAREGIPI